jgi:hypothetical protein
MVGWGAWEGLLFGTTWDGDTKDYQKAQLGGKSQPA